ncbi:MAG TPA: heme-binding domain-containing protein [Chryseosolibacter sp.]|nr:heme-binding domain-containing protein [Chryseosolibacter sp.]
MKSKKKIGLLIVILILVIQVIQPTKNRAEGLGDNDISKVLDVPDALHKTIVHKCYDCHSNNTRYPWYFNVQPIGWWLAAHVHEGKEHLNFSEWRNYSSKDAAHQLEEIEEVTEDGSMPLQEYVLLHPDSKLSEEDKNAILSWIRTVEK